METEVPKERLDSRTRTRTQDIAKTEKAKIHRPTTAKKMVRSVGGTPRRVRGAHCLKAAPAWKTLTPPLGTARHRGSRGQSKNDRQRSVARGCDAETCFIKQEWSAKPACCTKRRGRCCARQPAARGAFFRPNCECAGDGGNCADALATALGLGLESPFPRSAQGHL